MAVLGQQLEVTIGDGDLVLLSVAGLLISLLMWQVLATHSGAIAIVG